MIIAAVGIEKAMHIHRRSMSVLLAVGLAVVALGLVTRAYLGRPAELVLRPEEVVRIADLQLPLPRPSFLACPSGYCTAADMATPVFSMPWDQLREYWKEIAELAALVEVSEFAHRRAVYVARSPVFNLPDIVTVELVGVGAERSSIAIFSRSRYGGYDFAVNRKRVEHWLIQLQDVAHPAVSSHGRWH